MSRRVVVTGMGAVTPVGNDVESTWRALRKGESGVGPITRFDPAQFTSRIAAEIKDFQADKYMDARELKRTDLYLHYAMGAAKQAWEQAGLDDESMNKDRLGVFMGSGIGGLTSIEAQHSTFLEKGSRRMSPFFVPMVITSMAAGYVSIALEARGPVTCVVTACATGTNAIGDAFREIARGGADVIVAGGAEASITPLGVGGFCAARALSTRNDDPQGASRPFDKQRDGFVIGEGAGAVILESLEHAKARGAEILAEVTGYAFTGDAYHVVQPDPKVRGTSRAMKLAIEDAGWQPEDVDYINAHGTSTPFNDKLETLAIKKVFGDHAYRLAVNSTKSMVGHLLGAAGAVEFIVTVKSLQQGTVHPTINITDPDPECDLDYVVEGERKRDIRRALTNSFGFGGHNATLALAHWEG